MKTLTRLFAAAAIAAFAVTPAFAKECCDAAAAKTKKGEACEVCLKDHACCAEMSKKTAAAMEKKMECKTCAAASKKKTS